MRITAITPMRNEGPYIVEWLAHNLRLGVNDFLVFSNDCSDGTDLILERLDELGLIRHMPNPSTLLKNPRHHIQLIKYINKMPRLRRSDWVINLDADEFISVNTGKGRLEDLFNAVPEADAVSLSLLNYGCNGFLHIAENNALQTEAFTRCNPRGEGFAAIKSFMRGASPCRTFANNAPIYDAKNRPDVAWVNGDGALIDAGRDAKAVKGLPPEQSGHALAHINHYSVRSMQGFLIKRDRGSANPIAGAETSDLRWKDARRYWTKHDRNDVEDRCLADRATQLRAGVEELLRDTELRALHDKSLAWHRKRARKLRKDPDYADLLKTIRRLHRQSKPAQAEAEMQLAS